MDYFTTGDFSYGAQQDRALMAIQKPISEKASRF
jgi:hypothetical protein